MTPDQDDFRRRAIRAALAVAGIAAAIGLVVGVFTAGAVYMSGLVPEDSPEPTLADAESDPDDALPTPSLSPTPTPQKSAPPSPTTKPAASTQPTPSRKPTPTKSRRPQPDQAITLRASASSVESFGRVTLSGRYPGGNGTTLQVQRLEGGSWAAFPTSATVNGGTFSTYVASGQSGANQFRVVDPATGKASNVVTFTVS